MALFARIIVFRHIRKEEIVAMTRLEFLNAEILEFYC